MKYKDPVTGEYKEIRVKGRDTLPAGAIIEYEGIGIPEGYEEIEMEEDGNITLSTGTLNNKSYIKKIGKLVDLSIRMGDASIPANTTTILGSINFKPIQSFDILVEFGFGWEASDKTRHIGLVEINTDGNIYFTSNSAVSTTQTIHIKTTYVTND